MAEYDKRQRKPESRAITNSRTGNRQLKSFVDNRKSTIQKRMLFHSMSENTVMQCYVNGAVYDKGHADVDIEYPVGVNTDENPQGYSKAHLVANRFGGAPGGNNIVFMSMPLNWSMEGKENHVYHYIHGHPDCKVNYTVDIDWQNEQQNIANDYTINAVDTTNDHHIVEDNVNLY